LISQSRGLGDVYKRQTLETMGRTVFSHGVMNWTAADHWGYTLETGVMTKVVDGKFKVE
jgi:branched-chain amino acid transport system substrate-binding protein